MASEEMYAHLVRQVIRIADAGCSVVDHDKKPCDICAACVARLALDELAEMEERQERAGEEGCDGR